MNTKPYTNLPIVECGEKLVSIPINKFSITSPHIYQQAGAPYQHYHFSSPYFLRQTVLEKLLVAQENLQKVHPTWKIQIFDAYRPIGVQQYMVDYVFQQELKKAQQIIATKLESSEIKAIWQKIYQFWSPPNSDPQNPPPHSTGAALDVTLADEMGKEMNMGSPIDELSERSYPHHFAHSPRENEQNFHQLRKLLAEIMQAAYFQQHPNEWWHFSWGDQMWAVYQPEKTVACYGRVE